MRFTKMHGNGNDYIFVFGEVPENAAELSEKLSDRHFGVGADGMIYISGSDAADYKIRIFNADGSEAKMCGNGIRCVGKYVYEKGYTDKKHIDIETLSGVKGLDLKVENGKVVSVDVGMGEVIVEGEKMLTIDSVPVTMTCVSVGTPHAVVFKNDVENVDISILGPRIEHQPSFPGGVNAEFVQIINETEIRLRVWERGSGATLASGTGACAAAAAAVRRNECAAGKSIKVVLDGGDLTVCVNDDGTVILTGGAETICEGEIED